MLTEIKISNESDPPTADRNAVVAGLETYNARYTLASEWRTLAIFLRDDTGAVRGGLLGETAWAWLHIRILWIADDLRGLGYGRSLVEAAEREARERGCRSAHLDTFEFQARPFYEKLGYKVFGVLEDYPPGSVRYYLKKSLMMEGDR